MLYLDTSALVKLYIDEEGSARVRRERATATEIATSTLTIPEFGSAIARRLRARDLTAQHARQALEWFSRDMERLALVTLTTEVARTALVLVERHDLRGGDAVQLAAALFLARRHDAPETLVLAAADVRLVRAADAEGMAVIDVRND